MQYVNMSTKVQFATRMMKFVFIAASLGTVLFGAAETELKDQNGGTVLRYVVEPPATIAPANTTDPSLQAGLILCFPEHDRPTGDEILPVREALTRLGLRDHYVLLAAHPQAQKFGAADHEPIAKLIAWAKATYPINPRRIYMYGKGEGGKISGEIATEHPEVVTAAITYSWGWWTMPSELTQAIDPLKSAPEFYMVLGLRDLSYHLTTVRDTYSRVSAKGYHIIYKEFDDLGSRTYHPPSNDDAIAWATRLRNKNVAPSAQELKLLQHTPYRINENGYFADLALVGGVQAGEVLQKLLVSEDEKMRAAAAETFSYAIFSEAAMQSLAGKMTDPSQKVRSAAFRALGINAAWRSEAAQVALIDFATHFPTQPEKAKDPSDRVSAVDGIVHAARLQVKGAIQDPQLFQALVTLLDDKDEALRVMAANTLEPVRDREFRGDLGRPEQKTPDGGWPAWLTETRTKAAGYMADYSVCQQGMKHEGPADQVELFCKGGASLLGRNLTTGEPMHKDPALAFQSTLQAAEKGYVPAEAAVGMMFANGKGVQQNYSEAVKWWVKAAEGGHVLAAQSASMVYRGGPGVPANKDLSEKWAKFAADHQHATATQPSK